MTKFNEKQKKNNNIPSVKLAMDWVCCSNDV